MITYLIDDAGALSGPVTFPPIPGFGLQVPGNAVQLPKALAPAKLEHVWAMIDGKPQQIRDLRGSIFTTDDGSERTWHRLGDLPEGFTRQPRPGEHFIWKSGKWALDETAQRATQTMQVLDRRDELLREAQLRIAPLQYAQQLGSATDSETQWLETWMRYSVELNRIEQKEQFPHAIDWPTPPDQHRRR